MKRAVLPLLAVCLSCQPAVRQGRTTVAGRAMLVSPIVGAHVRITRIVGTQNEIAADTVTDEEGRFDVELVNGDGTLLIEVLGDKGGVTKEPVSQKALQLSYTDKLASLMTEVRLGQRVEGIIVSPWSSMIAARAMWDVETNKTPMAEALVSSAKLFLDHFAGIAFLGSEPIDPASDITGGLPSGAIHGFVTSGLAEMGADLSRRLRLSEGNLVNVLSVTQWLAWQDLHADGRFDGRGPQGAIKIVDDVTVDVEFTRASLGAALGTFITSTRNKSGVALADMTALINAITSDSSILYGEPSSVAVSDGEGPKIVVSTPLTNTTLRDQALVAGSIASPVGVAGAEIFLDDVQVTNGNRTGVGTIEFSGTYPLTDGFHVLRVVARDSNGKASTLSVPFSSDATPPTITMSYCSALDDRKRNPIPKYVIPQSAISWGFDPVPETDCTIETLSDGDEPYVFHLYSERARTAATSPVLGFVPQEQGPVTTPQAALIFEGALFKNGAQLGKAMRVASKPGETTRSVALSSEQLGDELRDVSIDDVLELRLVAVDNQGNEGSLALTLALDLLPSPLKIANVTPDPTSEERVERYTFANGLGQLLDPAAPLPVGVLVAQRFELTNVSDKATAFKIPLQPGSSLTADYAEWTGFVAGEAITNGTDSQYALAVDRSELEPVAVPSHWGDCVNNQQQDHLRLSQVTYPLKVWAVAGGVGTCVDANALLTTTPVLTAESGWVVRVHTPEGNLRFTGAGGDYVINPGESLHVTIGFSKPSLPTRQPLACTLTYEHWAYNSGFAPRQYTDFLVAIAGAPSPMSMPFGAALGPRDHLMYHPGEYFGWTYRDLGWVDCSGVTCGYAGCRTTNDQFVMRMQAAQHTTEYQNGYLNGSVAWMRTGYREWVELALSRFSQPHSLSIAGNASVGSTSRLSTNRQAFDFTLTLPIEQMSVSHSTTMGRSLPAEVTPAVYTKGALP